MVIFTKKMRGTLNELAFNDVGRRVHIKELKERAEALEAEVEELKSFKRDAEAVLVELKQMVENGLEDGNTKKTPQQLLREWFLGDEKNG
jgi:hypothetical protein